MWLNLLINPRLTSFCGAPDDDDDSILGIPHLATAAILYGINRACPHLQELALYPASRITPELESTDSEMHWLCLLNSSHFRMALGILDVSANTRFNLSMNCETAGSTAELFIPCLRNLACVAELVIELDCYGVICARRNYDAISDPVTPDIFATLPLQILELRGVIFDAPVDLATTFPD